MAGSSAHPAPSWLTDEAIERTMALGREMQAFLERRNEAVAIDADAKVEPHTQLLELFALLRTEKYGSAGEAIEPDGQ